MNRKTEKIIFEQNTALLKNINSGRNFFEEGVVNSGITVAIRIYIPANYQEGTIDIQFPSDDKPCLFVDEYEAIIKLNSLGLYKLYKRNRGRDIPERFYAILENNLLAPISAGSIKPYRGHVFGKGMIFKVAELRTKTWKYSLDGVQIISPSSYAKLESDEPDDKLPDYYENNRPRCESLAQIIRRGETEKIEFKSTLRWNIYKNVNDREIENSVLKTIVAFCNSDGGELLIGVADDGKILGLDNDKFSNDDKFLLHLRNIITDRIKPSVIRIVKYEIIEIQIKKICRVKCERSKVDIWLLPKDRKADAEEFYVRSGPSSTKLSPRSAASYIKEHF